MVFIRHLSKRVYSSALYLTGKNAADNFVVLRPVIDFEARIRDRAQLENNLKFRCLDVDLNRLVKRWSFYQYLDAQKQVLEDARMEIKDQIISLKKGNEKGSEEEIEKLITQGRLVKDDLRVLKDTLSGVEEYAALAALSLPNVLHPKTLVLEDQVIYTHKTKLNITSKSHIELGYEAQQLTYTNPFCYYLSGDLALFEYSVTNHFEDKLLESFYTQFSNSDFARSLIVEGCGTDLHDALVLADIHSEKVNNLNRIHLTGSRSLYSFMAYFARHVVQPSYFPLRLFASGQKYVPQPTTTTSLLNVSKETGVEVFIATQDDDELVEKQFEDLKDLVVALYESLNCHFRLVYKSAKNLKSHESLRMSVEMYSSHLQSYVEVGHCSMCDAYLSKRLLFMYNEDKVRKFPKVISGSILRAQSLIACMIEYQDVDKSDLFGNFIKKYVG